MVDKDSGGDAVFSTIILAAGKGTRMKSDLAKVLHPIGGIPMLSYTIAAARAAGSRRIIAVIGHQSERIREIFQERDLIFVEQKELAFSEKNENIIILCGDVPLIRPKTLKALYEKKERDRATVVVLTTIVENPTGYGRVLTAADGRVTRIVEEKDASSDEKRVREINTGIYCVESRFLFTAVSRLENKNAQREYYLTDIMGIACRDGIRATSLTVSDPREVMGINTLEELQQTEMILKSRK